MKIGVLVPEISNDLRGMLKQIAAIGADGVQFYVKNSHYDLTVAPEEELRELRRYLDSLHLELPAICGELGGHGFQIRQENPGKVAALKHIIDMAVTLGTPVVSTHIGVIPEDETSETYKAMLESMQDVASYAASCQVKIAVETGPETPEVLRRFVERAGSSIGANLDPANLVMVHNIDSVHATEVLKGRIFHTHAKDGVNLQPCDATRVYNAFAEGGFAQLVAESGELFREVPLGEGAVDFPRYLAALKAAGYDGYLTIEREVGEHPFEDIRKAVSFLKSLLDN